MGLSVHTLAWGATLRESERGIAERMTLLSIVSVFVGPRPKEEEMMGDLENLSTRLEFFAVEPILCYLQSASQRQFFKDVVYVTFDGVH